MKFQNHSKLFLLFISFFFLSCGKDDDSEIKQLPEVATVTDENQAVISHTSVEITGSISANDGDLNSYGVVWGTNPNPTLDDNVAYPEENAAATTVNKRTTKQAENTENSFTVRITDLTPGENYYFRTFASNDNGTAYGEEIHVSTPGLAGTKWEITYNHDEDTSWIGHVTFYEDGTAFYTEPDYPGMYDLWGEWSMDGNELTYDMIPDTEEESYILTGELNENEMSGTYTFNTSEGMTHRPWTAVALSSEED